MSPGHRCKRSLTIVVAAAMAVPIATNLLVSAAHIRYSGIVSRDSTEYWRLAENLSSGKGYSYDGERPTRMRQPAYPLFLALVGLLPGDGMLTTRLVQTLFTSVIIGLFATLAAREFGPKTAMLTAALVAVYAPLSLISNAILADGLYALLLALVYAIWVRLGETGATKAALGLGGLLGVLALTKPAGLPLLLVMPVAVWLQTGGSRRAALLGTLGLIAGFAVLSPWAIRNWVATGQLTVTSTDTGAALWDGVHPWMYSMWSDYVEPLHRTEQFLRLAGDDYYLSAEASRRFHKAALDRIATDPWGVTKIGLFKVAMVFTYVPGTRPLARSHPVLFGLLRIPQIAILVLAVWGAIRSPSYIWAPALSVLLVTAAGCFLGPATARYIIPIMPLALLLTAVAVLRPAGSRLG